MDKRKLRLALKEKLDERRDFMRQNRGLRHDLHRERERNKFLVEVLGNPLVDAALEACADHIMQSVIEHAAKASEVVANETIERGDYEIGISIPSLHIRHRLYREDVRLSQDVDMARPYRRVNVDTQ